MVQKNKAVRPIDAPLFKVWHALYLSFYSIRLYVDVVKRWRGFGFVYIQVLLAILCLPLSIKVALQFNQFYQDWVIAPTIQTPTLMIQNGQLVFDKPMPYLIKNKFNKVVAIVDTAANQSQFSAAYPYLVLLITKDAILYRVPTPRLFSNNPMPEFTSHPIRQAFSKEMNELFNPKAWFESSHIELIVNAMLFLLYPIMIAVLFGFYIVFHLAITMLAQLVSKVFFHFPMTYKQNSRLLAVSATPALVLFFIFFTLGQGFYGFPIVIIALMSAYFSYATLSVKRESQVITRS